MTPPATPHHMRIGTRLARLLDQRLGGEAFTDCTILTSGGVRIADVSEESSNNTHADAFAAVSATYEQLWAAATVQQ